MKKGLFILVLVLVCYKGHAEPDKYARFLLNEPVTLMDLFLYRMERYYEKKIFITTGRPGIKYEYLSFKYAYNSNRIYLNIFFTMIPAQRKVLKKFCESYKESVQFLFDPELYTVHYGWQKKYRPKNLDNHIKKITYFKLVMFKYKRSIVLEKFLYLKPPVITIKKGDLEEFSCEGPLFGKKILYSD